VHVLGDAMRALWRACVRGCYEDSVACIIMLGGTMGYGLC
jgi:hypothetical protein